MRYRGVPPYQFSVGGDVAQQAGEIANLELTPVSGPIVVTFVEDASSAVDLAIATIDATRITAAGADVTPLLMGAGGLVAACTARVGRSAVQPTASWMRINRASGSVGPFLSPGIHVPVGKIFALSLMTGNNAANLSAVYHLAGLRWVR